VQLHLRRQVRQPDVVTLEQRQDRVDLVSDKYFSSSSNALAYSVSLSVTKYKQGILKGEVSLYR
jgi:hypothetical protein